MPHTILDNRVVEQENSTSLSQETYILVNEVDNEQVHSKYIVFQVGISVVEKNKAGIEVRDCNFNLCV